MINMAFSRAGISAGDFHRFHDARFEEECSGHRFDIRLASLPSVDGPSMVLRVLDKSRSALSLSELGYAPEHLAELQGALKRPHGLILFTGPTGSGKTTALYSMLNCLKGLAVKVVTAEDPVEIGLPLVTQVAVDLKREHDFHNIARALLRHDPDVMLVGEIRDERTAREAVRAAVTGHRVLATLHANDVTGALIRLYDLGVDPLQAGYALTCVVAQRLVRKLCPLCREFRAATAEYVPKEAGCSSCFGGYKGRTVVAEVMRIDQGMRLLLERGSVADAMAEYRKVTGRLTMEEDALRLVRKGSIGRVEIERVLG